MVRPSGTSQQKCYSCPSAYTDKMSAGRNAGDFSGFDERRKQAQGVALGEIHPRGYGNDAGRRKAAPGVGKGLSRQQKLFGGGGKSGASAEFPDGRKAN